MVDWGRYPEWRAFAPLLEHDWIISYKNDDIVLASCFLDGARKPVMIFSLSRHYLRFGLLPLRVYTTLWKKLEGAVSGPQDFDEIYGMRAFLRENVCDYFLVARNERIMGECLRFFDVHGFCEEIDALCRMDENGIFFKGCALWRETA